MDSVTPVTREMLAAVPGADAVKSFPGGAVTLTRSLRPRVGQDGILRGGRRPPLSLYFAKGQ
jgi:hypothetical protein